MVQEKMNCRKMCYMRLGFFSERMLIGVMKITELK